jgi:uncharacterized RDD family membrane protein YckC
VFCTHCGTPNPDGARQCANCKTPFTSAVAPSVRDRNIRPELEIESLRRPVMIETEVFAGFWRRFAAIALDYLVLLPVAVAIVLFLPVRDIYAQLIVVAVHWLYFAGLESGQAQGTWGKGAFGIKVTDTEGERIGFLRATWRWIAKFFSALPLLLGFLLAAVTGKKRALHDYLAVTVVVRKKALPLAIQVGQGTMPLSAGVVIAAILLAIAPVAGGFVVGYAGPQILSYRPTFAPYLRVFASRAVVDQSFTETDRIIDGVEAFRKKTGKMPTTLEEAGVTQSTTFISGVLIRPRDQAVTFIVDGLPGSRDAIDYKLTERGGKMVWVCTSKTLAREQLSPKCRA